MGIDRMRESKARRAATKRVRHIDRTVIATGDPDDLAGKGRGAMASTCLRNGLYWTHFAPVPITFVGIETWPSHGQVSADESHRPLAEEAAPRQASPQGRGVEEGRKSTIRKRSHTAAAPVAGRANASGLHSVRCRCGSSTEMAPQAPSGIESKCSGWVPYEKIVPVRPGNTSTTFFVGFARTTCRPIRSTRT